MNYKTIIGSAIDYKNRIIKDFKELQEATNNQGKNLNFSARLVDYDLNHWKATIFGPPDTCYAGGAFVIDI